jgi:DNA replication protein DnaC
MEFVRARENVVLLGPPGVGKTHLAVSLGIEAINQGYRVQFITAQDLSDLLYSALADGTVTQTMNKLLRNDLIILDELGYVQFDTTGSDHLFQIIAKAYENRSLIVTSNLDFED